MFLDPIDPAGVARRVVDNHQGFVWLQVEVEYFIERGSARSDLTLNRAAVADIHDPAEGRRCDSVHLDQATSSCWVDFPLVSFQRHDVDCHPVHLVDYCFVACPNANSLLVQQTHNWAFRTQKCERNFHFGLVFSAVWRFDVSLSCVFVASIVVRPSF